MFVQRWSPFTRVTRILLSSTLYEHSREKTWIWFIKVELFDNVFITIQTFVNLCYMRTSKAQTSLHIRAVWSTFRVENVIVATKVALTQFMLFEHRVIKLDNN